MDDDSDTVMPTNEEGFLLNEKEKWFKEEDYIKQIEINNNGTFIYPSEISNNINERIITLSFKAAIEINSEFFYNKIVLDINSGIGLNSLIAAKAGAKKVYSLESNQTLSKYQKIFMTLIYQKIKKLIL